MAYDKWMNTSDPSKTFTLTDFVNLADLDDGTYFNYSIIEVRGNLIYTDHSLLDDYLAELDKLCVVVTLTEEEYKRYRYQPDILSYDLYGSVQLDFVIMKANDIIDPKEFTIRTLKLPVKSYMRILLEDIRHANQGYLEQNRLDNGMEL